MQQNTGLVNLKAVQSKSSNSKHTEKKGFKKNKQSLNNLQGRSSKLTITIGVQREGRENKAEKIFEEILTEMFPNLI